MAVHGARRGDEDLEDQVVPGRGGGPVDPGRGPAVQDLVPDREAEGVGGGRQGSLLGPPRPSGRA
ncbi:hypothetical protein ACFQ0M_01820 [Kitasatospora aburaviensis]